ncbi:MAG: iron-containing alcohol dehydrogenase [Candidatus Nanopelagicales bacterium]|nr:iron-containing alcohol dehydrogenase [Candidatus Nanopelagicales bacterium]
MPEPLSTPEQPETVFTYAAPTLVYGPGAIRDIAFHLRDAKRVLIVTDPGVVATGAVQRVIDAVACQVTIWDDTHIEPTDVSLQRIADYVRRTGRWDAFVAVGGGSSIDTAKAANLMFTNPGALLDYVNAPIGGGRAPEQPLKPLIAVPTTTGTGSESTTICVLDVLDRHVKTGISHARLRPTLAIVDPDLTMTQPAMVTACAGLDILCHALESYTARPYTSFEAKTGDQRVPYCGANPISDMWAERALTLMAKAFIPAVRDGDAPARAKMALAATLAGMGFGNAGVHIPHANAYPIAGRVREFRPPDYPQDEPLIPHGMAVSLTAPAAFSLTHDASPDRHRRAAYLLGGADLPSTLREIMDAVGIPAGLKAVGYTAADIPDLVEGALAQRRLLALAPLKVSAADLAHVFRESL